MLEQKGETDMNTLRLTVGKIDFEKVFITLGISLMEVFGVVTLFCGILDIKIF